MTYKLMSTVTADQVHFVLINVGRVEKTQKQIHFAMLSEIISVTVYKLTKFCSLNATYTRVTNAHWSVFCNIAQMRTYLNLCYQTAF